MGYASKKIKPICLILFVWGLFYRYNFSKRLISKEKSIMSQHSLIETKNFQDYCDKHGDWYIIKRRGIFIRRTGIFYFLDANILRVQILIKPELIQTWRRFFFGIILFKNSTFVSKITIHQPNINIHQHHTTKGYSSAFFEVTLPNSNIEQKYLSNEFDSMKLVIIDKRSMKRNTSSIEYLSVKVKYMLVDKSKKKGAMLCGKCLHLTKKDDFSNFRWWMLLQKKLGFEKIFICDHLIEKNEAFSGLFAEHRDLLEIAELKCIPNLRDDSHFPDQDYLRSFNDMNDGQKLSFTEEIFEIINLVIINECYMSNIDKYNYIQVTDADELVLPKLISRFNKFENVIDYISRMDFDKKKTPFDDVACNSNSRIDNFIENELLPQLNIEGSNQMSYHFKHGSYLFNNIIDELFESFKTELGKRNLTETSSVDESFLSFSVEAVKADRVKEFNLDRALTFTVKGKQEFIYAMQLMRLYDNTIKPMLDLNRDLIKESIGDYERLFFVSGDLNDHVLGKSIHNTRRTMDIFLHFPISFIKINEKTNKPWIDYDRNQPNDLVLPRNLAHLSHYRRHLNFDKQQSEVPFSVLNFDVNYFKCFFVPLVQPLIQKN